MSFQKGRFSVIIIFTLLVILLGSQVQAQVQIPEKVRVGLYFKDISRYTDTAITSFFISAQKGLQIGYSKGNNFTALIEEASSNTVTVRKDTYYNVINGTLVEYDPAAKTLPKGEKIGPYHVQLAGDFSDYSSMLAQLNNIKKKGITAYPVFTDTWQIWTGFYTDSDMAQQDIANNITSKLGAMECKVIEPSPERIVILDSKNEIALLFGNSSGYLQIHPKAENNPYIFNINNTTYRGVIEVIRNPNSDMTVINVVPLEEYLYGVVPYEIGASSPMEALKAQAVSARTYTLNSLGKFSKLGFDVCTTTACQVYRGNAGETQNTNKAVNDTKGKIITYGGKPAQVFYFASSGGHTENVKNVWGAEIPYLIGVPDKYESGNSRYYNWESVCSADELKNILSGMGKDVGDILGMQVTKVSDAGRAIELVIRGTKSICVLERDNCRFDLNIQRSQLYELTNDAEIKILGANGKVTKQQLGGMKVMTSSGIKEVKQAKNYNITILDADNIKRTLPSIPIEYTFTGKGWGHAVGMSQEGAKGMALQGYKYDSILTHYYPGTKVE